MMKLVKMSQWSMKKPFESIVVVISNVCSCMFSKRLNAFKRNQLEEKLMRSTKDVCEETSAFEIF